MKRFSRLQLTQPTSGGAVTAVINYCANCVELSRPQQWGPDIPFFWQANNSNKQVCICNICYKQIHVRKQISIMCNRIEHWVPLRSLGIRQAQYTDTRTCHLHRESRLTTRTDIYHLTPDLGPSSGWTTTITRGSAVMKKSLLLPG